MKELYSKVNNAWREYGKVTISLLSLVVVCISCASLIQQAPQKFRISFLDVGQGDAILIQTPHKKTILIDGGPSTKVINELSKKLSFFNRSIDVVIATHPDSDHITGLLPVLDRYKVNNIIISKAETDTNLFIDFQKQVEEEQANIFVAEEGDVIDFYDGVKVFVLHPDAAYNKKGDTNNASVSVLLTYGEHSFLLTGDLAINQEQELLTRNNLPRHVTVFKAGHHGSKTSSGERLLSYIRPEYSVISAGKDNRYGHPHEETLTRLKKYSQEVISTIDKGTISFVSDGRILDIVTKK